MTAPASLPGAVFLRRSYLLLLLGGVAAGGAFVLFAGIEEYVAPLTRVPLFVLWIEAPFLLLAFNVYLVNRFLMPAGNGPVFIRGTLLFLGSGLLIYGRALSLPAGQVMDRNLIFLSGPFYHFAVAAAVMVGFMARGLYLALGGKDR